MIVVWLFLAGVVVLSPFYLTLVWVWIVEGDSSQPIRTWLDRRNAALKAWLDKKLNGVEEKK